MKYSKRVIFALIFFFSSGLFADKFTIAVLDFKSRGVSKLTAKNVSELVRTELIESNKYRVIERSQLNAILREQGFQQSGCTDVTCAVKIGKLVSARKIMVGNVMKFGKKIVISGRIVDVEKGVAESSAKQTANSNEELIDATSVFIKKLTGSITEFDELSIYSSPDTETSEYGEYNEENTYPADNQTKRSSENSNKVGCTITAMGMGLAFGGLLIYNDARKEPADNEKSDLIKGCLWSGAILSVIGILVYAATSSKSSTAILNIEKPGNETQPFIYCNYNLKDSIGIQDGVYGGGFTIRF